MERILLLNDAHFPADFNSIGVPVPAGISKIAYVEKNILRAINKYNHKLQVSKIEYLTIENQFKNFKRGDSNGALIEEFEIDPSLETIYSANECYVWKNGAKIMCRRILMYVFISNSKEKSRTSFVSQTVFPTLLDYADEYIKSPSYSIANHKFCFINVLNKKLSSKMILRQLASLIVVGMEYIEAFDNLSLVSNQIPKNLRLFLEEYATDFATKYDASKDVYEDDNYKIDFFAKIFTWKTSNMIATKLCSKQLTYVDFIGSNEKFYWIETLPMSIFAYNQGYIIDYSDYKNFVTTYKSRFSPNSKKFARCEILLKYMEKYFI